MLIKKMLKKLISIYILLILSFSQSSAFASNSEFNHWVKILKYKLLNLEFQKSCR